MYEELEKYLNAHVSESMQREIVRRVIGGYRWCGKIIEGSELAPGPVKNIYPVNRSAAIDTMLLGLMGKYEGFEIRSKINSSRNYFYTLIDSPHIRMTVSYVRTPKAIPREAKFRSDYASIQARFVERDNSFEIVPPESCDKKLYTIILHGVFDKSHLYIPGFIYLGFPSDDCRSYITRINLTDKYRDTVQEVLQQGTEYIEDMAQPGLIVEMYRQREQSSP
jgi:hypothetical protein